MNQLENLYGWYFTYSPSEVLWSAATSEHIHDLSNNIKSKHVLRSHNILTLIELIIKTNGETNRIKKLIDGK